MAQTPRTDDLAAPFSLDAAPVRGRVARLGAGALDPILRRHSYPAPVALLLGEALLFAALMASLLKTDGRLIVQAQGDGPVPLLVAEHKGAGALRGYARLSASARETLAGAHRLAPREIIGAGVLAVTLDRGEGYDLHQGFVPLEAGTLAECAQIYFRDSEQIEARLRLAVGEVHTLDAPALYRGGGLLMQKIAGDAARGDTEEDWRRASILFGTVEDAELLDPALSADRVLYRLFHEEGVRLGQARPLADQCSCNEERLAAVLHGFDAPTLEGLTEPDGLVHAQCQFCARAYRLDPARFARA
ncbi:MAG: Hsp33 family molecular chaperone HslO [Hyphomonadaceae bacterium]